MLKLFDFDYCFSNKKALTLETSFFIFFFAKKFLIMRATVLKIFFFSLVLNLSFQNRATAQEAMLGEIHLFAGNFVPRGWAACDGRLLPISQNQALFAILGTTYGGDGRTNFALPDLRSRVPVGASVTGRPPAVTTYTLGQTVGTESTTLTMKPLPMLIATNPTAPPANTNQAMVNTLISPPTLTINNVQPALAIQYIICTMGIFPTRE
jgi:microcystin-dependent protein